MSKNLNYYFTNDFGGGGTNVSRVFYYYKLIKNTNINLLLNYFYLETSFKKSPSFNTKDLSKLKKYNGTLINFLNEYGEKKIEDGLFSSKFKIISGIFKPKIFLDSGSGNLLKVLGYTEVRKKNIDDIITDVEKFFEKNVKLYLDFANKFKVDIFVVLDYADKGTYKQKESHNKNYLLAKKKLINDFSKQKKLIKKTINYIKLKKFHPKTFVPIHGKNIQEYLNYFMNLINLEKEENFKFDGFALGGIGRKKTIEICKILENLKKVDDTRTFHILGSSGIKKIISLFYSGATSFDCHTPWRRASDGEGNFLIPLLDKNLKIINNDDSLDYKKLNLLDNNYNCDCEICANYPLIKIKSLYYDKGENNYFAKILIYFHWIHQYDRLLKKIKLLSNKRELIDFINKIANLKLKENILKDIKNIESYRRSI